MKAMINGIPMIFDDAGSGPAVVLLHGQRGGRAIWQRYVGDLVASGFRVVIPDLGSGGEDRAEAVVALLNYLGIGRAAFIAQGQGDPLLLRLLERHPRRIVAARFAGSPEQPAGKSLPARGARMPGERPAEFRKSLFDFLLGLSRCLPARQILRAVA
jgi:pimeloyl-ACP methyl ester carboxylesterase